MTRPGGKPSFKRGAMSTSPAEFLVVSCGSLEESTRLAGRLGRVLKGGEFLALTGDLGAGKTHFVKGLAAGLNIDPRLVTSPTFLLIHELEGRLGLVHMDAYRVHTGEELAEAGGADLLDGHRVIAVEWAERVPDFIPDDVLEISIRVSGEETRVIEFRAGGSASSGLLRRLAEDRP